jgi:hypothetical protein
MVSPSTAPVAITSVRVTHSLHLGLLIRASAFPFPGMPHAGVPMDGHPDRREG